MFYKVAWHHMQGVVGFLVTTIQHFSKESSSDENFLKIGYDLTELAVSLWAHFFGPPCRFIGVKGEEAGVS